MVLKEKRSQEHKCTMHDDGVEVQNMNSSVKVDFVPLIYTMYNQLQMTVGRGVSRLRHIKWVPALEVSGFGQILISAVDARGASNHYTHQTGKLGNPSFSTWYGNHTHNKMKETHTPPCMHTPHCPDKRWMNGWIDKQMDGWMDRISWFCPYLYLYLSMSVSGW